MIPYGSQKISNADIEAVIKVLKSDYLTQGPVVPSFEKAVSSKFGAKGAVAVNSATSALHIACLSLGLKAGDWLWTSPISFVASSNCGLYCGASIDFVDIDPFTYNISVNRLAEKLAFAENHNKLPRIIVVPHMCGLPADLEMIYKLKNKYGFYIIEDASHAIGSVYQTFPTGSCHYSDIVVFSFHPVKIITTGEGGVALANDDLIIDKMQLYRSHGITRDPNRMTKKPDGPWYYEQICLGFNYRMTEMQAALGISQLAELDHFVDIRNEIATRYLLELSGLPVDFQRIDSKIKSSYHLFIMRINSLVIKKSIRKIHEELMSAGIGVNLHYIPIHLQPYYENMGFQLGDFPEAEGYYKEAITLPIYPKLTYEMQSSIIEQVRRIIK